MARIVDFHRAATAEMIDAARVYERKREGLGFRFIHSVEQATQRIADHPKVGAQLGRKDRRWVVFHFPFSVIYRFEQDRVLVLAIMHQAPEAGVLEVAPVPRMTVWPNHTLHATRGRAPRTHEL